MKELINPTMPQEDFPKITEYAINAVSRNPSTGEEEKFLRELFVDFQKENWEKQATNLLDKLIAENKPEVPYFTAALKELKSHLDTVKGEDKTRLLTLFLSAYLLSFYEYSKEKLADSGFLFKASLADNVDPATRGQGSYLGYIARLKNYVGGQLIEHQQVIHSILESKPTGRPKLS